MTIDTPGGHQVKIVYRRPRRRVLQRPARVLPLDQLRAAVLPRPPHDDGGPRVDDPQDAPRARGEHSLQFRPEQSRTTGRGVKLDLPPGPLDLDAATASRRMRKGNYRFVYSGKDAQAGQERQRDHRRDPARVSSRATPDERPDRQRLGRELGPARPPTRSPPFPTAAELARASARTARPRCKFEEELKQYKLVDTDGQPFADAALNEREDNRQLGANNFWLAPHFVMRLAHLGWGFGPSISRARSAVRVRRRQLAGLGPQDLRTRHAGVPARQEDDLAGAEHARRLVEHERQEDPAAAAIRDLHPERQRDRHGHERHLAVRAAARGPGGDALPLAVPRPSRPSSTARSTTSRLLERPGPVGRAQIEPKTPPNPLKNDKEFLKHFPYLAEPW